MQDSNYGEERNKLEDLLAEISRLSQSRLPESRNRAAEIQVRGSAMQSRLPESGNRAAEIQVRGSASPGYQSPETGRRKYR